MPEHLIPFDDATSDLLACAAYIAESIRSGDGRAAAMEAIVPVYLARSEVDLAAELANTVDDSYMRDRLLIRVAEKCAEIDDVEYALQLAEAIEDHGPRSHALETIGIKRATAGDFETARSIAERLDHPEFVLAAIAARQVESGDRPGAEATLDEIEFPAARVTGLEEIAAAAHRKGDSERALETANRAVLAAGDIPHDEERTQALCGLGNLFIEMGRNDRAIETYESARANAELIDNVHRDPLLALAAAGFSRAGSVDLADRALDMISDKTSLASGLLSFAREHARKGENAESAEVLEEAIAILRSQKEKETRDTKAKNNLHSLIAAQFAGVGGGERAIEVAAEINDEATQVSALSQIARVLVQRNDTESARMAIRAIPDDASRVFALIEMSDAYLKNGEIEAATAALSEAAELAETVPQLSSRSSAYNEIAKRFYQHGDLEKFNTAAGKSLETIRSIRDDSIRSVALAEFSSLYTPDDLKIGPVEKQLIAGLAGSAGN